MFHSVFRRVVCVVTVLTLLLFGLTAGLQPAPAVASPGVAPDLVDGVSYLTDDEDNGNTDDNGNHEDDENNGDNHNGNNGDDNGNHEDNDDDGNHEDNDDNGNAANTGGGGASPPASSPGSPRTLGAPLVCSAVE